MISRPSPPEQSSNSTMTTLIFGVDPESLVEEWREEGLEPTYGSIENDLLIQAWEDYHDPVPVFKEEGLYEKLKAVVDSSEISGIFYRSEDVNHLQVGDLIDYRSCLTRWTKVQDEDGISLKLTCEKVPGLELKKEVILGECQLKVVSRSGNMIEVTL